MLEFRKLLLTNFGPYKGDQCLDFAPTGKVTVVYGENMRGKTTLLNALRYSLTGVTVGRSSQEHPSHLVGNWEAAEEGSFGFSTTLLFSYQGTDYEINRICKVKNGVSEPSSDDDYVHEMFMVRDGATVGPDESASVLAEVMPREVVRFFLFDAELLQEYEALLRDHSEMGKGIRSAIERILGVPLLTNARACLRRVLNDIQEEYSKAASKNAKLEQIAGSLRQCLEKRRLFEKRRGELDAEHMEMLESRQKAREQLRRNEKARSMLSEKESLERSREAQETSLLQKQEVSKEAFQMAWLWSLMPLLEDAASLVRKDVSKQRMKEAEKRLSVEMARLSMASMAGDKCLLCDQVLDESSRKHLRSKQKTPEPVGDTALNKKLAASVSRLSEIEPLIRRNQLPRLESSLREIEEARMQIAHLQDQIQEIDQQVVEIDNSALHKGVSKLEEVNREIALEDQAISDTEHEITTNETTISRLQKELDRLNAPEIEGIRQRRDLAESLFSLYEKAVGEYREALRVRIETDATRVFLDLTTEPDYGSLRINENYGLTIVHKDGSAIPIRSSGAEHVVALSLIASLQNNAPIHGPVVMDSPFGRLDEGHKRSVVRSLPRLAEQVCLLVYRSEVHPDVVREELKGTLGKEYTIRRITARHSVIEAERGSNNDR